MILQIDFREVHHSEQCLWILRTPLLLREKRYRTLWMIFRRVLYLPYHILIVIFVFFSTHMLYLILFAVFSYALIIRLLNSMQRYNICTGWPKLIDDYFAFFYRLCYMIGTTLSFYGCNMGIKDKTIYPMATIVKRQLRRERICVGVPRYRLHIRPRPRLLIVSFNQAFLSFARMAIVKTSSTNSSTVFFSSGESLLRSIWFVLLMIRSNLCSQLCYLIEKVPYLQ